jgi:hypothetical protein
VSILVARGARPPDLERLLRARPFGGRLDPAGAEPVPGQSGTAFFVRDGSGRRYKLRACASARRAREIERLLGLAPEAFPRIAGRDGRLLLLEALDDHRPTTRAELVDSLEAVGALVARLHRASERAAIPGRAALLRAALRARLQLARDLRILSSAAQIEPAVRRALAAKLGAHRRRFGFPVAVEMDDLHRANFMRRDADGDLRYVDEEGVAVRPFLTSLASLVKTADRREHWHAFRAGYAQVRDAAPITPEYTEYVVLVDTVRKVANKLRSAPRLDPERLGKLPAEIDDLRRVALREDTSLDWGFYRG